ncbi:hypothetical protein OF83DRAFT_1175178 [Amylostereum chailletii]|nr:hypothetical protein OF83DRAFT_1175178 [Amylostereum chailletii]
MVSTTVMGEGVNWYHFPDIFGDNPTKVFCRTTEVDAYLAAFIKDDMVMTFGNSTGCVHVLDAKTGLPISVQKNPPSEEWKKFLALAVTLEHAYASSSSSPRIVAVAFDSVDLDVEGHYGISLYKLNSADETSTLVPLTYLCFGFALSFTVDGLNMVAVHKFD